MLGIRFLSNQDWNDICSFEHCAHGRNMRSSTKESRISGCLPMVALLVGIIVGRKKIHPKIWTTLTLKRQPVTIFKKSHLLIHMQMWNMWN